MSWCPPYLINVTYRLHLHWTLTYIHPKIVIREFIWQLTTSFWTMKNLANYVQKLFTVNEKSLLPFRLALSYQLNAWKYMEDWQFTKGIDLFESFGKEIHWSNSTFFKITQFGSRWNECFIVKGSWSNKHLIGWGVYVPWEFFEGCFILREMMSFPIVTMQNIPLNFRDTHCSQ